MNIEDAWKLYLGPGGKSVENRNRIVELMYGPLLHRMTVTLDQKYHDAMTSEVGFVLLREVDAATRQIELAELATLIREKDLNKLDCPPPSGNIFRCARRGNFHVYEYYEMREREEWKTGPDSAVDDPTIRRRPYSASLIAAEKRAEATGTESILVRLQLGQLGE